MATKGKLTIPSGDYSFGKKSFKILENIIVDTGEAGVKQLASYLKAVFKDITTQDINNIMIRVAQAKEKLKERQEMHDIFSEMFGTEKKDLSSVKSAIDLRGKDEKKIIQEFSKKVQDNNKKIEKILNSSTKEIEKMSAKNVETVSKIADKAVNNAKKDSITMSDIISKAMSTDSKVIEKKATNKNSNKTSATKNISKQVVDKINDLNDKAASTISKTASLQKKDPDYEKILKRQKEEYKKANSGSQLSLGIVPKKIGRKPSQKNVGMKKVPAQDTDMNVSPQMSFDYGKAEKEYREQVAAKEQKYKEEQARLAQERKATFDKQNAEDTAKEEAKQMTKAEERKIKKSLKVNSKKIAKEEDRLRKEGELNTNKEQASVTKVASSSKGSNYTSYADIKQAMKDISERKTLEPKRRIDDYVIEEYNQIKNEKARDQTTRGAKAKIADYYLRDLNAQDEKEIIKGVLHKPRKGVNLSGKARQAILDKELHKLDLEYAPEEYIKKLEQKTGRKISDKDFVEESYKLRNKDKEIKKEMDSMRDKLQKNFVKIREKQLMDRNKELENVKYGIHVGSVITPGKNNSGKGKTNINPILFKNEADVDKYLKEINPNASNETIERIKRNVLRNYDSDFKNVYTNKQDMGANIYGLNRDITGKVNQRALMTANESEQTSQLEKIRMYSGAQDDVITKALLRQEQQNINATNKIEENKKNKDNKSAKEETEQLKETQETLKEISKLQELQNQAYKKNIDIQQFQIDALEHQKQLAIDILKINEKINILNRKESEQKRKYVDIIMDEKSTAEQKKEAQAQIKAIEKEYKEKRKQLNSALQQRQEEERQSKDILAQGYKNYFRSQNVDEDTINRTIADAMSARRRRSSGGSSGGGGNGGGGFIQDGDYIFPVNNNQNSQNQSKFQMAYNDITNTYGRVRSGMYMFSQMGSVIEDLSRIEEAVYDLGVVGQLSTSEISSLRKELLYTGTQGRYTTIELAESAADIVRTGRSFEESMSILKQSRILATASFDNVRNSTNTLIKAMTAFNLSAESAAHAANSFHNIVNATPLDLKTFDDSLRQTSAAFGSMVYFSSKSGTALEEYKKQVVDTTAVLTGLQAILG